MRANWSVTLHFQTWVVCNWNQSIQTPLNSSHRRIGENFLSIYQTIDWMKRVFRMTSKSKAKEVLIWMSITIGFHISIEVFSVRSSTPIAKTHSSCGTIRRAQNWTAIRVKPIGWDITHRKSVTRFAQMDAGLSQRRSPKTNVRNYWPINAWIDAYNCRTHQTLCQTSEMREIFEIVGRIGI